MDDRPDIILIAYHFPPDPAIGSARPYRFYRHLRKLGRRCWVVTAAQPAGDIPPDVIHVPDRTAALWESGEKMPFTVRVQVERLLRRYLFPAGLGLTWSLDAARQCRKIARANPGRHFVAVTSFPPVGTLLAGLRVSYGHGMPWVADFRDPVVRKDPDVLEYPIALRVAERLERISFRRADRVIANTEQIAVQWRERYPQAREKIHTIWNGFDPDEQPQARSIPPRGYRMAAHAGTLYVGRTPGPILESLERLRARQEARDVRIVLLGSVEKTAGRDAALWDRAAGEGWLELRGTVPRNQAQRVIEESDFLLLLQPQSAVQVPGKLFEYLSVGRPVIAYVPRESAVEHILEKAGVPYACLYPDEAGGEHDRKLLAVLRLPATPTPVSEWYAKRFGAEYQAGVLAALADGACGLPGAAPPPSGG